ncbi:hypothetical protein [Allorhizocola rhizosphaerae]|uniref:hypothetical protein n=1 Tax=Allorhizocola rhizosphaerae TaxID=1872709 RepID=UPI001B8B5F1D|nr:hypothetical protein [Allorhizocola rhizosphaerae]
MNRSSHDAAARNLSSAKLAGEQPDDGTAARLPATDVVGESFSLAQVDEQCDGGVRDHGDVRERGNNLAEPGHLLRPTTARDHWS